MNYCHDREHTKTRQTTFLFIPSSLKQKMKFHNPSAVFPCHLTRHLKSFRESRISACRVNRGGARRRRRRELKVEFLASNQLYSLVSERRYVKKEKTTNLKSEEGWNKPGRNFRFFSVFLCEKRE